MAKQALLAAASLALAVLVSAPALSQQYPPYASYQTQEEPEEEYLDDFPPGTTGAEKFEWAAMNRSQFCNKPLPARLRSVRFHHLREFAQKNIESSSMSEMIAGMQNNCGSEATFAFLYLK